MVCITTNEQEGKGQKPQSKSVTTELAKLLTETEAWNRAYLEIMAALRGDKAAIARNHAEVERMRQRERDKIGEDKP